MFRKLTHGSVVKGTRFCIQNTRTANNGRLIDLGKCLTPALSRQGTWETQWRHKASAAADAMVKPDMFCYQCEQTKSRRGCVTVGVCGKTSDVSALQDLLIYTLQGLAMYANRAINMGCYSSVECDDFMLKAMFSTLTNVNFDEDRFPDYIRTAVEYREDVRAKLEEACRLAKKPMDDALSHGPATWFPEKGYDDAQYLIEEGKKVGVLETQDIYGTDINGVRYMTIYGIKGLAAYASHAAHLGEHDPWVSKFIYQQIWSGLIDVNCVRYMTIYSIKGVAVYPSHAAHLGEHDPWVAKFIYQAMDFLQSAPHEERHDLGANLKLALKVGETNLRVMELLDRGHRRQLGVPSPHNVTTTPVEGKCILVSGHDLMDLYTLLKSTEGTGINVYTHGEMLPAHSYPKLREFKSLAGHFGGAWQNQKIDFAAFPGPVIITTNCVIEPLRQYRERLYTLNETGLNSIKHIDINNPTDVNALLQHAQSLQGFDSATASKWPDRNFMVGFGREAITEHAQTVLDAVGSGDLTRVFVIGGCDGSEHKRSYFTTLAKELPPQTLILTMGCAKFRLNEIDFGTLGNTGIPRLLDMGQCNDSFGAVMVAKALASALNTDINSLPLSISLSWFEQKAVAVLLSLLSLGVKNIRLGPVMPAFLTPNVRKTLEEAYGIVSVDIRHPVEDMEQMME